MNYCEIAVQISQKTHNRQQAIPHTVCGLSLYQPIPPNQFDIFVIVINSVNAERKKKNKSNKNERQKQYSDIDEHINAASSSAPLQSNKTEQQQTEFNRENTHNTFNHFQSNTHGHTSKRLFHILSILCVFFYSLAR